MVKKDTGGERGIALSKTLFKTNAVFKRKRERETVLKSCCFVEGLDKFGCVVDRGCEGGVIYFEIHHRKWMFRLSAEGKGGG